eukprot:5149379-Pyramimonas_sp.AAC.1
MGTPLSLLAHRDSMGVHVAFAAAAYAPDGGDLGDAPLECRDIARDSATQVASVADARKALGQEREEWKLALASEPGSL